MRILITLVLMLHPVAGISQLSLHLGHNYLRAQEWDNVMHYYNYARPWQDDELKPLSHGYDIRAGWIFRWKAIKSLYVHPQIGIRQFSTSANNNREELFVRLRQYSIQCDVNFNPRALFHNVSAGPLGTRWFMFFSPSVQVWRPYVEQAEQAFYTEGDEEISPTNWSWSAALGVGYRAVMISKQFILSPKFGLRYTPKAELDDLVFAVQGGNPGALASIQRNLILIETGLEFVWIFPRTKSGKGYMKPCSNC